MVEYFFNDEWKEDVAKHANDQDDLTLSIPEDITDQMYDTILSLLKKNKFKYRIIKGKNIALKTPTWYCTSYADVMQYLCLHERVDDILWDIKERIPEAVLIENTLIDESMRKEYISEHDFAAGEGFSIDDDGNWRPMDD